MSAFIVHKLSQLLVKLCVVKEKDFRKFRSHLTNRMVTHSPHSHRLFKEKK